MDPAGQASCLRKTEAESQSVPGFLQKGGVAAGRTAREEDDEPMSELHGIERYLNLRSVEELIRLLKSGRFERLTDADVRTVGEYGSIELDGESFFARAFSAGKEVAASLALARELGVRNVLCDLLALRATMLGAEAGV